jgi:hypothetical protein
MYKKLIAYDFDGTLFHTPTQEVGREIWKKETGFDFPHNGWWGKSESIDPSVFDIPLDQWVYKKYLEDVSDPENYVILATGRLAKAQNMLKNIKTILNQNNISFDEIHLNWGGDTYNFKTKLFEEKIEELGVKEFILYDDRQEHLVKFEEWSKTIDCKIKIVDVVNRTINKNY